MHRLIRYRSENQLSLEEFDWPIQVKLDEENRWVKPSEILPWDEMAEGCYQGMSKTNGRPGKDACLVIGAVTTKHKLCLPDEEALAQIQENPYFQYFVGPPGYQKEAPFAPSLFVDIRKRMGEAVFEVFQQSLIGALESSKETAKRAGTVQSRGRKSDDDDDSGMDMQEFTVTVQDNPPVQTIDNLTARTKSEKLDLVWTPVAGAQAYHVYGRTDPGQPWKLVAAGHSCDYCVYAHFGLSNDVTYHYYVTSVTAGQESAPSNEVSATPKLGRRR